MTALPTEAPAVHDADLQSWLSARSIPELRALASAPRCRRYVRDCAEAEVAFRAKCGAGGHRRPPLTAAERFDAEERTLAHFDEQRWPRRSFDAEDRADATATATTLPSGPHVADAVRTAHVGREPAERWEHVAAAFGLGETFAKVLCRRCGVGPIEVVGGGS